MKKRPKAVEKGRLSIRLLPEVEDKLRGYTRRHGDLSRMIGDALDTFELDPEKLPNMRELVAQTKGTPPTTLIIDMRRRVELRKAAARYGSTMNAIVNAALAQWRP